MTIKEASALTGLTPDTLRYYERIGLLPYVRRSPSGIRDYDDNAISWIEFIKCMRSAGLTLETLVEYVTLFKQGDATLDVRKNILVKQRKLLAERIEALRETLHKLDMKIEHYDSLIYPAEEKLRRL